MYLNYAVATSLNLSAIYIILTLKVEEAPFSITGCTMQSVCTGLSSRLVVHTKSAMLQQKRRKLEEVRAACTKMAEVCQLAEAEVEELQAEMAHELPVDHHF